MSAKETTIVECCGCGRFRPGYASGERDALDSCVECDREGARGRVWDSSSRAYVALSASHGSGYDFAE